MTSRKLAAALTAGILLASASAARAKSDPSALSPSRRVKAATGQGYYDDVFALAEDGKRIAVLRTDGATFSKVEIIDAATAQVTKTFELPSKSLVADRLELLAEGKGLVLIAR